MALDETRLALLEQASKNHDEAIAHVVERTQLLVDQYHEQNRAQAAIARDVEYIRETLDAIQSSQTAIRLALDKDYVRRPEFVEMKAQWHKFLGTVLLAVLGGVLALTIWRP